MKLFAMPLLVGVLVCTGPAAADKTTTEPKTPIESSAAAQSQTVDERLAQKVTYDGDRMRLHDVVDDLAEATGVKLRCGSSNNDWRVRDMPVLVCARDISLGALLRGIADSTHLLLSSNRVGDTKTYRIWRDLKREKQLAAFQESQKAAAVDSVGYDWDILSLLRDVPESGLEQTFASGNADADSGRLEGAEVRAVSNMLTELGLEARDRLLGGEALLLSPQTAPDSVRPYLKSAFQAYWGIQERMARRDGQPLPPPLDEESLDRCCVKIWHVFQYRKPVDLQMEMIAGGYGSRRIMASDYEPIIRKHYADLPPKPKPIRPGLDADDMPKHYVKLSFSDKNGPAVLDAKTKIPKPKSGAKPNYSSLLREISRYCGYSIVAEGTAARLRSESTGWEQRLGELVAREITVRDALAFSAKDGNMDWYLDEKNKLIVGRDKEWIERLEALAPEQLLLKIHEKLKSGIDLDDLEPFAGLTRGQINEWVAFCPEIPEIELLRRPALDVSEDSLWRLYYALSAEDRTNARAGRPVSLADYDSTWTSALLSREAREKGEHALRQGELLPETFLLQDRKLSDPDALPELSFSVSFYTLPETSGEMAGKRVYRMSVDSNDDEAIKLVHSLSGCYPILAPKPKAEDNTPPKPQ